MELYFAPLACSLATRIALYKTGDTARFRQVNTKHKRVLDDDSDFLAINPMGQVPTLRTDDGEILTENAAVLQHVADRAGDGVLAARAGAERVRLQQWLSFVGTELHKGTFAPLLDAKSPEGAKTYARDKGAARLARLAAHLRGRDFVLDRFSVVDAYLVPVLNWASVTGIELSDWPALKSYFARLVGRPAVAGALGEEVVLYREEVARRAAR